MKDITLILLLFCSISYVIQAQFDYREGYIVKLDQDTVEGLVEYRSNAKNYKSCKFKTRERVITYKPDQLLGFGYKDDKYFVSGILENRFVEALVLGKMDLYHFENDYFVQKDTGKVHKLKETTEITYETGYRKYKTDKSWVGKVIYLVSDCLPDPQKYRATLRLNDYKLSNIVKDYNECSGEKFTVFKESKAWYDLDFGIAVGIINSTITFEIPDVYFSSTYFQESYTSIAPTFGAFTTIKSPRISERFSIQPELHIFHVSYEGYNEVDVGALYIHRTKFKVTTLHIPLSVKYSFPEKSFGLDVLAGFNYDYNVSGEALINTDIVYFNNEVETKPERKAFKFKRGQIGLFGGIGLKKVFQKFRIGLEGRYYYMPNVNNIDGSRITDHRIGVSLILSQ